MATIVGHAQRLLRDERDPERRQALLTIGSQAYRIRDMIADVMLFARPPQPVLTDVDLVAATRTVVDRFAAGNPQHTFQVDVAADEILIRADATQLAVVVSELLRNSVQATLPPATILVRLDRIEDGERSFGRLHVVDRGTGLSELDREHLFDPFYSGRQAGRGLGFGLPKCWRIVTLHGGRIEVACGEGQTKFTVLWPV